VRASYEAGRARAADVAQARGQCELFRANRSNAQQAVLTAEGRLRELLGVAGPGPDALPVWAPFNTNAPGAPSWAPSDAPVLPASLPDWKTVRRGAAEKLTPEEVRSLGQAYRRLVESFEAVRVNRAQREAFAEQARARGQEHAAGRATLDVVLEAERFLAAALAAEHAALARHARARCRLAFAQGGPPPRGTGQREQSLPALWKRSPPLKAGRPPISYRVEDFFPGP
jgi:outer membrane protein TolC